MKFYNTIFDIFLYESFFMLLFSGALSWLNDPMAKILLPAAVLCFVIAVLLGIAGKVFHHFRNDEVVKDFT
jgi:hypothetical protein